MSKEGLKAKIAEKLKAIGITPAVNAGSDLSVDWEFLDAKWSTGEKKIEYHNAAFLDEADRTLYYWESSKEIGSGFSFGGNSETSFQSGMTLMRKVKSIQYGPDGKAYEYDLDLGQITRIFKETAKEHDWKFKVVLKKDKALFPAGYAPVPAAAPAASSTDATGRNRFCGNCGAQLQPDSKFCASCGAAVTGAGAEVSPPPVQSNTPTPPVQTVAAAPAAPTATATETKKSGFQPAGKPQEPGKKPKKSKKKGCLIAILVVVVLFVILMLIPGGEDDTETSGQVGGEAQTGQAAASGNDQAGSGEIPANVDEIDMVAYFDRIVAKARQDWMPDAQIVSIRLGGPSMRTLKDLSTVRVDSDWWVIFYSQTTKKETSAMLDNSQKDAQGTPRILYAVDDGNHSIGSNNTIDEIKAGGLQFYEYDRPELAQAWSTVPPNCITGNAMKMSEILAALQARFNGVTTSEMGYSVTMNGVKGPKLDVYWQEGTTGHRFYIDLDTKKTYDGQ